MTARRLRLIPRVATVLAVLVVGACQGAEVVGLPPREVQPTTGPQFAAMTGRVRDAATFAPIAGARVQIGDAYTFSGADGTFSLTVRYDNVVPVTVARDGYATTELMEKFVATGNVRTFNLTRITALGLL